MVSYQQDGKTTDRDDEESEPLRNKINNGRNNEMNNNGTAAWKKWGMGVALVALLGYMAASAQASSVVPSGVDVLAETNAVRSPQWPSDLFHRVALPPFLPATNTPWPTNTMEAAAVGWMKGKDDCVPELGEVWLYKGRHSSMSSVTLFFSPQIGDVPGDLIGIEVNYYGEILEGLVGSYFSKEKLDEDSNTYHTVAVGFRDPKKYNLCDDRRPLPGGAGKYIAVAPQMANLLIPTMETSKELVEEWHEGSCLDGMGYHWFKNTIPGVKELTYKKNTVVPVVPMYHPDTHAISGIFFWAPQRMQVWDDKICNKAFANFEMETLTGCFTDINFWDPGPGLLQMNAGPLYMCSNSCDKNCYFEDSVDGTLNTMHFFFYKADEMKCPSGAAAGHPGKYCRNDFDFTGWSKVN